jgi:hypothetical protein
VDVDLEFKKEKSMSDKAKWNEKMIARAISIQLLDRKCVVLIPNCNWTGSECDVFGLTTDLRIIDVEVKISRADFKADAKKDKWWHGLTYDERESIPGLVKATPDFWGTKVAQQWPRKVWKHYYAIPKEIWKPELLEFMPSQSSGILLIERAEPPHPPLIIRCEKRATPNKDAHRVSPQQAVDIARLANIRMWEAFNQLERKAA